MRRAGLHEHMCSCKRVTGAKVRRCTCATTRTFACLHAHLLLGPPQLRRMCLSRGSAYGDNTLTGESPGGISPPGAPRTVLEPLGSHGSRCSAVDVQHAPMCEQSRVCTVYPSQPVSRAFWPRTQTFVLVPRPADQVGIYASECWMECRLVEMAVVVDPAPEIRVVLLGQVSQGQVAPSMQGPSPDRLPDCFQCLRTGCRQERDRVLIAVPYRLPRPKRIAKKVEKRVWHDPKWPRGDRNQASLDSDQNERD